MGPSETLETLRTLRSLRSLRSLHQALARQAPPGPPPAQQQRWAGLASDQRRGVLLRALQISVRDMFVPLSADPPADYLVACQVPNGAAEKGSWPIEIGQGGTVRLDLDHGPAAGCHVWDRKLVFGDYASS